MSMWPAHHRAVWHANHSQSGEQARYMLRCLELDSWLRDGVQAETWFPRLFGLTCILTLAPANDVLF